MKMSLRVIGATVTLVLIGSAKAVPPVIVTQPSSQNILALDNAILHVSATGSAPLGYQWRKDGVLLTDDGRFTGSATATLTIAEFLRGDAGTFTVAITNGEGIAISSNAVLAVAERLRIRRSVGSLRLELDGFHLSAATFADCPRLILETSSDLRHWGPALTNSALNALVDFLLPRGDQSWQFQRVVLPDAIVITILYDNYGYAQGTTAEWGFSCLIEGTEKTVLFDTGQTPGILLANAAKVGVGFGGVSRVVISHDHGDHTGGLSSFLRINNRVTVWLPYSASTTTKTIVLNSGASLRQEQNATLVCSNVFLTGEMTGRLANEQALMLETSQGLIVVVGCSHPGVVQILQRAKQQRNRDIYWVIGGFHLIDDNGNDLPRAQILPVIDFVKNLGVTRVSATHCTGNLAISLFREAFGTNYIAMGTGRIVAIPP
jgi:7,8-dihydropterin-6-yl-methyl-4-(beta-D-ribofuranosyl)aminobenzene 5'-phosphate synthase